MNIPTVFRKSALHIAVAGCLGVLASPASLAQEQDAGAQPDDNIDEVVVTGTRVAARTRLDSLAPVDVLSYESLTSQATTELAEALSNAAPSLNFPRPSITDGTDHIRPATLRGLAPDQTLVLVNSKRRHQSALVNVNGSIGRGSAAVDLNAIPLAAVETVEVLRDGASAQYGSDAIAGVINLRLREAREGGNASITYGEYNSDVETERGQRKRIRRRHHDGVGLGGPASRRRRLPHPVGRVSVIVTPPAGVTSTTACRVRPSPRVMATPTSKTSRPTSTPACRSMATGTSTAGLVTSSAKATRPRSRASSTTSRNVPAIYPNGFLPLITTNIDDLALGWGVRGAWAAGTPTSAWSMAPMKSPTASKTASTLPMAPRRRRTSTQAA